MRAGASRPVFTSQLTNLARKARVDDEPLVVLDDARHLVLVEHGEVDLFAVRLENGRPAGRWTPLCRVVAGAVLVPPPRGPERGIVGRAAPGAVLSYLPAGRFTSLSGPASDDDRSRALTPAAVTQLARGIDAGISALADVLPREPPPAAFVPLVPRDVTVVADMAVARSAGGVLWVEISRGSARQEALTGPLAVGGRFCVAGPDWLVAKGDTRLVSCPTVDLLADGSLWSRLAEHQSRLLHAVDLAAQARDRAEEAARDACAYRESDAVKAVAMSFEAVTRGISNRARLADVASDQPDLAAVRLVASHLGFSVQAPGTSASDDRKLDPVQRITLANRVRTRVVRLEGPWWRKDIGPLLVQRKTDGRLLALLPARGGYQVADPAAHQETRLTKAVAADLGDRAVMLYRPLPAGVNQIGAVLRFAISGTGKDVLRLLLTSLVVATVGLLAPIMTGRVLGDFVEAGRRDLIAEGALLVIAGAFLNAAMSVVQNVAALRIEGRSAATLQAAVWSRLLSLPTGFFNRHSTGDLAVAALGVSAAQEALSGVTTTAALGLLTGSVNLILVFFYDIRLALTAVCLIVACAAVCAVAGYREVHWQRGLYDCRRQLSAQVFQLLNGLSKLRVAAAEDRAFIRWSATFTRSRGLAVRARQVQNLIVVFNAIFPLMASVVIFGIVAGPLNGKISIAAFLSFNTAFILLTAATLQFTGVAITTLNIIPLLERIKPILNEEPESTGSTDSPGDLSGEIMLNGVCFRYGEGMPLVLDDINLSIQPGEFVAIVGPTGCGKSTLLRLLLGFEQATAGSVLFDGKDLARLDASAVRRQCGVVLQNGELLAGDIKSNIIGSSGYAVGDAWGAARMASIDDDIAAMPMAMSTVLSEGATTLSGGQRQRIMIARALVSRPRIILFDEATSALDNPTQAVIAENMRRLQATRVIIAHRLSSVADADRIVVLDKGRIVQQGSYSELIADQRSLFASLARQQFA